MLRRVLINPFATFVLFALLFLDARAICNTDSTAGLFYTRLRFGSSPQGPQQPATRRYTTVIIKEPTGIRILDPDSQSWDEATKLLAEHPAQTAALIYRPRAYSDGFWAIATLHREFEIETASGSSFSEDDWHTARSAMLRSTFGDVEANTPNLRRLAREDFKTSEPIWSGYLHNTLTLLCLALLLNSLRWIPRTPAYFRARRAARGLCPHCGYSLAGLAANTCPECGSIRDGTAMERSDHRVRMDNP